MVKASREFQVFAKPAGAVCNLNCRYCYYLDKQQLLTGSRSFRMPDDLLELYITQHIEASPGPVINFSWHGGEPTVLGLDYFRRIVEFERRHRPPDRRIINGIQTNGILLDEEWCLFLASEGFGVGLSLDGPQEMHDCYRVTRGGEASHMDVLRAFRRLKKHRVPCDMLCVVHDQNVRYPARLYRFFKDIGARYITFLPAVEPLPDTPNSVSTQTVPAPAYGEFLCSIFDEWLHHDVGRIAIQIFEEAAAPSLGLEHSLCIFRETCGDIPVVEHNGDFYSCDHFVDERHRIGNIRETPLVEMLESREQAAFGQAKLERLPRYCRECEVRVLCNGGCPKDRFIRTPDGEEGLNYLCAGFKRFFMHYQQEMLSRLKTRSRTGQDLRQTERAGRNLLSETGRNDPCPCGSGRKYKKCCLSHGRYSGIPRDMAGF